MAVSKPKKQSCLHGLSVLPMGVAVGHASVTGGSRWMIWVSGCETSGLGGLTVWGPCKHTIWVELKLTELTELTELTAGESLRRQRGRKKDNNKGKTHSAVPIGRARQSLDTPVSSTRRQSTTKVQCSAVRPAGSQPGDRTARSQSRDGSNDGVTASTTTTSSSSSTTTTTTRSPVAHIHTPAGSRTLD
ncbi:hypothetical protein GGTG_08492 [Gaeumannomyces tritici R3-111a-1]|uniref:Uncharacterized protein n=1 Tax=Gaeumannomyces tritici (strain R3-111a-1) TaxID=644352 RepID=J3P4Q5_GAET3|nr:hypothetical protein GGTG_08492 [Gaeumannomyces tritici R3-111a-1]EJT74652.1 hypothetical protein GGTG_08492 [Gaeumannomyces tritici R3-111a-1]